MKTVKNVCLSIVLIFISTFCYTQEPAITTLVASKNCDGTTELIVDLEGGFTTETWNNEHLRIVMEITTNDATKEVVKHLIREQRYSIKAWKDEEGGMTISAPNLLLPVEIEGKHFSDSVSYRLYVPDYMTVRMKVAEIR